jgi:hypothetical protein
MPPNDSKRLPSLPTAENIKALQLPVGVKVRLDPSKGIDTLHPIRFFDQDCACFGANQGNLMEVEVGLLVEPRNQFVILDGPAGYGKSYLLARVKRVYQTDMRFQGRWRVVSVCLKTSRLGDRWKWLIETMIQQLDLGMKADPNRKDYALLEIANQIKQQDKALLVLLDGLVQASEDELVWLRYRLPYQLRSVLGTDVRVILSGRHISRRIKNLGNISGQVRQRERLLSFEVCTLSPFDKGIVQQIIHWHRDEDSVELEDELVDRWVEEICFLSGGHPEAIIELTDDLVRKTKWGWVLQDRQFLPEVFRQELYQRCLEAVSDSVLKRILSEDIKELMLSGPSSPPVTEDVLRDLDVMTLLRRFEGSLLVQLHSLGLLATAPTLLRGMLVAKGLSGYIDPKTGWQENDGVRNLLALRQRYGTETRQRCLEIHRRLHAVFHNRVLGCEADGAILPRADLWLNPTNILLSIFESLYHFLSGIEEAPQSQDQAKEMENHFVNLMVHYLTALEPYCLYVHDALELIWGMLYYPEQDDVRFLAHWLLGDDIWLRVHDALSKALSSGPAASDELVEQTLTLFRDAWGALKWLWKLDQNWSIASKDLETRLSQTELTRLGAAHHELTGLLKQIDELHHQQLTLEEDKDKLGTSQERKLEIEKLQRSNRRQMDRAGQRLTQLFLVYFDLDLSEQRSPKST